MTMKKITDRLPGRRDVLKLGAVGAVALLGLEVKKEISFAQGGGIVATPALTEGPYFVDEMLNRSDIRVDPTNGSIRAGLPLQLGITVSRIDNGVLSPLTGAYVDIWHCDAAGVYSDIASENSSGEKFLRGYQVTNAHGVVKFVSVYPGWYSGRTVHIHSKVRLFAGSDTSYEFTTQFFFNDSITDKVYTLAPYNTRPNRDIRNSADGIYTGASDNGVTQSESGALLLLRLAADASHAVASFHFVLDLAAGSFPGTGDGGGGTPPGGGGPGGGGPGGGPGGGGPGGGGPGG